MATITKLIREYMAHYDEATSRVSLGIRDIFEAQKTFSPIPTLEELRGLFFADIINIDISDLFEDCTNLIASPKLPEEIYCTGSYYYGLGNTFHNCTSLKIPPKLSKADYAYETFYGCTALLQAPIIPAGVKYTSLMFAGCTSLAAPISIPPTLTGGIREMFNGCTSMSGEMVVRPTSIITRTDALKDTVGNITLYGSQYLCERIAATANNGNAHWSPWYDPVPAVTDRGPGSYTTAADMTRMVRNGALAVNTYAPGRMVYQQGDFVRQDEWEALVNAAKTIDPTVTLSSRYDNLNKIEAAFDSVL